MKTEHIMCPTIPFEIRQAVESCLAKGTAKKLADKYLNGDRISACKSALACTRDVNWKIRLDVINIILGLHGTEAIRGEWENGYWGDIVASYCNTGDTYHPTVLHVRGNSWNPRGKFIVCSWGDWVEANQEKYQIQ